VSLLEEIMVRVHSNLGHKVEMHFTDTAESIPFIISLAEVV